MNNPPSYFDYVREAFNASPRLPGLGNLPLNWMGLAGFATLGLLNPGFLLIGAAVEIAFLATLSNNARFQNYVRGKAIADDTSQRLTVEEEAVAARLVQLDDEDQKRYESLIQRISAVPRSGEGADGLVAQVAHEGLETLRKTFLDVLLASARLAPAADLARRRALQSKLDAEVRAIEALGTEGDPRIRRSRQGTLDILRKRIAHVNEATRDRAYLDSELRRIEQQVGLVIDEASLADDPEALTRRIDQVTATFGETREWMQLHKELLADIDPSRVPGPVSVPESR
ncbi:MAG: hypothetical protein ACJAZO_000805 [Myxococcota bacterium]